MIHIRCIQVLCIALSLTLLSTLALAGETFEEQNRTLHFDQPQTPLTTLNFKQKQALQPLANDFRIIEASYLSNEIGERWAVITFENKSSGQRLLKNKSLVATFADGHQTHAINLNETLTGHEKLSKAVFFGVYQFPIVTVQIK